MNGSSLFKALKVPITAEASEDIVDEVFSVSSIGICVTGSTPLLGLSWIRLVTAGYPCHNLPPETQQAVFN